MNVYIVMIIAVLVSVGVSLFFWAKLTKQESFIRELKDKLIDAESEVQRLTRENDELDISLNACKNRLDDAKAFHQQLQSTQESLETANAELAEVKETLADTRVELDKAKADLSAASVEITDAKIKLDEAGAELAKARAECTRHKDSAERSANELSETRELLRRAHILHPDLSDEIANMLMTEHIDEMKKLALEFNRRFGRLNKVRKFKEGDYRLARKALEVYETLLDDVKLFVEVDINRLERVLEEHETELAAESARQITVKAERTLKAIPFGTKSNQHIFEGILAEYYKLDERAQSMVDGKLIEEISARNMQGMSHRAVTS